jgi:hypothetical protein
MHRIRAIGFHSKNLHIRPQLFNRVCYSRNEPTSANRHKQRIERAELLTDFQPDHARSGGDSRPFKWMHEKSALLFLDSLSNGKSLVHVVNQDNFRAIVTAGCDTHRAGAAKHYNFRANAELAGRKGGRDSVVARTDSGHASCTLVRSYSRDGCEGASRLECPCTLQELQFPVDTGFASDQAFNSRTSQHRGAQDLFAKVVSKRFDRRDPRCLTHLR